MTASGERMVNEINKVMEPHHDTIYCTERQRTKLARHASGPGLLAGTIDSLVILGLNVETLPRITHPIVCEKGEVFTLARDFQDDGK